MRCSLMPPDVVPVTKFYFIISENDKIMLSKPRHPHFLAFERHAELAASELSRVR